MQNHPELSPDPTEYTVDLGDDPYESIGEAVIHVVATHTGTNPEKLDPLADSVDPEVVYILFESAPDGLPDGLKEVTFQYLGLLITVTSNNKIRLRLPEENPRGEFVS